MLHNSTELISVNSICVKKLIKISALLLVTTALFMKSFGQRVNSVDSLLNAVNTLKDDSNKVKTINRIALEYLNNSVNINETGNAAKAAIAISTKLKWKNGLIKSFITMGSYYNSIGNPDSALYYYQTSMQICNETGDSAGIANNYSSIGLVYNMEGQTRNAIEDFCKAIELYKRLRRDDDVANEYLGLSNCYGTTGNRDTSIYFSMKALDIFEKHNSKGRIADCFYTIGDTYLLEGRYVQAMDYLQKALKIHEETKDEPGICDDLTDMGQVFYFEKSYEEALSYYDKALAVATKIERKYSAAMILEDIANVYNSTNEYTLCIEYALRALRIAGETNTIADSAAALAYLAQAYSGQKKMTDALTANDLALSLFERMVSKPNISASLMIKASILLDIVKSNSRDAMKHLKMSRASAISDAIKCLQKALPLAIETKDPDNLNNAYFYLSGAYELNGNPKLSLMYLKLADSVKDSVFSQSKVRALADMREKYESDKKDNTILLLNKDKALQELQTKKQKQTKNYFIGGFVLLAFLSMFAYNNYRTRQKLKLQTLRNKIARDLHDDVGSTLSSIAIFSQMAQEQSKEVQPLLATIEDSSRKMLDAMADIVWTINPENDQFEKIIQRMRSFAYELLGAKNIDFEFIADDEVGNNKLSMEERKNLYLIFKEATNNMVKYSGANKALFSIKEEKGYLSMLIRDNGKGFDISSTTLGNGLKNMKKRAEEIGAELIIDSMVGNGTSVSLRLAV
jgi:signal transduction histidine kinase/Tfp pilus assembly protein PilF